MLAGGFRGATGGGGAVLAFFCTFSASTFAALGMLAGVARLLALLFTAQWGGSLAPAALGGGGGEGTALATVTGGDRVAGPGGGAAAWSAPDEMGWALPGRTAVVASVAVSASDGGFEGGPGGAGELAMCSCFTHSGGGGGGTTEVAAAFGARRACSMAFARSTALRESLLDGVGSAGLLLSVLRGPGGEKADSPKQIESSVIDREGAVGGEVDTLRQTHSS